MLLWLWVVIVLHDHPLVQVEHEPRGVVVDVLHGDGDLRGRHVRRLPVVSHRHPEHVLGPLLVVERRAGCDLSVRADVEHICVKDMKVRRDFCLYVAQNVWQGFEPNQNLRWSKRLGYNTGHQEFSRCCPRDESEESIVDRQLSIQVREPLWL